ncbi:terpene cyclase/mutase family protein [Priestia flexa]|uniref:terpene cyclase/mutase family protein n=1 Tax=Priestia flexa TaxID=86664 RepID=UPI002493B4FE|nr:prenyltransferase/squalene oxidase repeat-containing protein [Priestia flexa]
MLQEKTAKEIHYYIQKIQGRQSADGSFQYCFEGGVMTDSFLIMLLRSIEHPNQKLVEKLTTRIVSKQNKDGVWTLHDDEKPNPSATLQAYAALLYSGFYTREDRVLRKAEAYLIETNALSKAHFMTKWMLAANGLYDWPSLFYLPLSFLVVPPNAPLSFYNLSAYARIHFIPMMIVANKKFSVTSKHTPSLSHLLTRSEELDMQRNVRASPFLKQVKHLTSLPSYIHRLGYQAAERYMLDRLEDDGTLYSYASATFFMIYALLALGYKRNSPIVQRAVEGIYGLASECSTYTHIENSTSTVWDTALLTYALQEAGLSWKDPMIRKATSYLQQKQHSRFGDWRVHNPGIQPGGWGFSHNNTINPDLDDTSAAIRALTSRASDDPSYFHSWQKGINWLLSMQNRDGGFAAFEKNTDSTLFTYLPLENAEDAATDPATADLTGRVLECLGSFGGMNKNHPKIQAAVDWLFDNQEENGSWYGRWGVCYIYGTWAAVTGLLAVGVSKHDKQIVKAINWLKSIQRSDGGWGESCSSAKYKRYIPLSFSTPSQTAWAIDALLSVCPKTNQEIIDGVSFLLNRSEQTIQQRNYPTGIGLPGQFYINYHSYNDLFPLLALSHYQAKA